MKYGPLAGTTEAPWAEGTGLRASLPFTLSQPEPSTISWTFTCRHPLLALRKITNREFRNRKKDAISVKKARHDGTVYYIVLN